MDALQDLVCALVSCLALFHHFVPEGFDRCAGLSRHLGVFDQQQRQKAVDAAVPVENDTCLRVCTFNVDELWAVAFRDDATAGLLEACRGAFDFFIRQHLYFLSWWSGPA